jgi:hypothetical protein
LSTLQRAIVDLERWVLLAWVLRLGKAVVEHKPIIGVDCLEFIMAFIDGEVDGL